MIIIIILERNGTLQPSPRAVYLMLTSKSANKTQPWKRLVLRLPFTPLAFFDVMI